jgi:hypothetical protein
MTPTLLIAANQFRVGVLVTNLGTTDVWVGNFDVSSTTGSLLPGSRGAALSLPFLGDVYGVTGGSQTVSVLEVYN